MGSLFSRLTVFYVGVLFPAYKTWRSLQDETGTNKSQPWMIYWVVYSIFNCAEFFADSMLSWLPFYYTAKISFLSWLSVSNAKGARLIFAKYIHPILQSYQESIQTFLRRARCVLIAQQDRAQKQLQETGRTFLHKYSTQIRMWTCRLIEEISRATLEPSKPSISEKDS